MTNQVEVSKVTYIWFIVSYLNYRLGQTNFVADYSHNMVCIEKDEASIVGFLALAGKKKNTPI